jgi:hypothetical protein
MHCAVGADDAVTALAGRADDAGMFDLSLRSFLAWITAVT